MAESNNLPNNVYSENDTLDINELASLNDDISPEFIEQLQSQVSKTANKFSGNSEDDSELFEEVKKNTDSEPATPTRINIDENIDDNFVKKYKARLNKQQQQAVEEETKDIKPTVPENTEPPIELPTPQPEIKDVVPPPVQEENSEPEIKSENKPTEVENPPKEIENLTGGNIIEKPVTKDQVSYNDSLDLLDNNVKYSKYVIYIDPENKEFIDSLTVKERKNLINRIIREQDDIAITKRRLGTVQTIIKHIIIAIITVAISIPVIYVSINASLEATINNHRRSQNLFQTLYKEHGKIKTGNIK